MLHRQKVCILVKGEGKDNDLHKKQCRQQTAILQKGIEFPIRKSEMRTLLSGEPLV